MTAQSKKGFAMWLLPLVAVWGGCADDPTGSDGPTGELAVEITGYFDTRAYLTGVSDDGLFDVSWSSKENLWVFDNCQERYRFTGPDHAAPTATFTCAEWIHGRIPQYALFNPKYTGVLMRDGALRARIPEEQAIVNNGSFAKEANVAVGRIRETDGRYTVGMAGICGLLRIRLLTDGIDRVSLTGNDGEYLAGVVMIDCNDGEPSCTPEEKMTREIALIPRQSSGEPVKGTYYFCALPQTFRKGITLTFTDTSGRVACISTEEAFDLERERIVDLGSFGSADLQFRKTEIDSPAEIDFSRTGYHFGEEEFPVYDSHVIRLNPIGNGASADKDEAVDRTEEINEALERVEAPGTVILQAGRYYVSGALRLGRSRVILRGEVDESAADPRSRNRATIISTRTDDAKSSLLTLGNLSGSCRPQAVGEGTAIVNSHLPEGSLSILVEDAGPFRTGERVLILRPGDETWIHDLGMDAIPYNGNTYSWTDYGNSMDLSIERIITDIRGNNVTLDNPLPMSIDAKYGGGKLCHAVIPSPRVTESGVEDLNFDTVFDPETTSTQNGGSGIPIPAYPADERHCWNAVRVMGAEHCWVRGITGRHFSFSTVSVYGASAYITVEACHSYDPVSLITGSRRYAFAIGEGSMCLFRECSADQDRHSFVTTGAGAVGPHAFVRCTASNSYSDAGPHAQWATCTLYDGLKTDGKLSVEDASYLGYASGAQGWQGANQVFWNCEAESIVCQSPQVSARNWAWGCTAEKLWGSLESTKNEGDRPDGEWYSQGARLTPESLYEAQLEERLAGGTTLRHLASQE